jgi:hypothetical protein
LNSIFKKHIVPCVPDACTNLVYNTNSTRHYENFGEKVSPVLFGAIAEGATNDDCAQKLEKHFVTFIRKPIPIDEVEDSSNFGHFN